MAKRRIRFELGEIKIAGIKLEIDDDLDSATAAFSAAQQLITGSIQPALNKALLGVAGPVVDVPPASQIPHSHTAQIPPAAPSGKKIPRARATTPPKSAATDAAPASLITLTHDPIKFGNPKQEWKTAQKAIWLLWVVEQATDTKELSSAAIEALFNKYYRDFGTILKGNVHRDLGKERKKTPALVGVNVDKTPQAWHLFEAGKTAAKVLADSSSKT